MKNNIIFFVITYFFLQPVFAENLLIEAKNISIDKKKEVTVFKEDVLVKTDQNHTIESEFAEYDKIKGILKFKDSVKLTDSKNNVITTNSAEYNENKKIFKTIGLTNIVTSENYLIEGENIVLNKQLNSILSDRNTIVKDEEGNSIYLNSFEYKKNDKIFKSIGQIRIQDKLNNSYEFSQIYIDTEKKKFLGQM